MITTVASGTGPSLCTVTPGRLRPSSPKSPPPEVLPQQQHLPLATDSSPESNVDSHSSDDWEDHLTHTLRDDTLHGTLSPAALTEFLGAPFTESLFNIATSSSGDIVRGIPSPSLQASELYLQPSEGLGAWRRTDPTELEDPPGDLIPDISTLNSRSSAGRTRRKSKLRDIDMTSNHGRDICIAVVGAPGVGKSTFIQKAYDLHKLPSRDEMPSKRIMVDKVMTEVKLVEFDWTQLHHGSDPPIWPKFGDGQRLPFVDGVLILYDVTNRNSLERAPELLDSFNNASLPNLLVSCKCDAPLNKRQIDPQAIEHVLSPGPFGGVEAMQTSANAEDSQKKCLTTILNMIITRRNVKNSRYLNGRRRANSSTANTSRTASPRPSTARNGHSRASSEFSGTLSKDSSQSPLQGPSQGHHVSRSPMGHPIHVSPNQSSVGPQISALDIPTHRVFEVPGSNQLSTSSPMPEIVYTQPFSSQPMGLQPSEAPFSKHRSGSISEVEETTQEKDNDDIPILARGGSLSEDTDEESKAPRSNGFTWDELVDRLLAEKMSKADQNFVTIFLCFYRKISPPRELIASILHRFDRANSDSIKLSRINTQLRYCTILNQWVQSHPGDFAHPKTRQRLFDFIDAISNNRTFALLAKEMQQCLSQVVEDEDDMWGRSDAELDRQLSGSAHRLLSTSDAVKANDTGWTAQNNMGTSNSNLQPPKLESDITRRASDATSHISSSSSWSSVSMSMPLIRELHGAGAGGILIEQYDHFMLTPDEEIATELTRIDWCEFSRIRPRDLVRHVSIPVDQKEKYRSLVHVNRMISHFNHVAYWVANVILEKPKPKYRGKALEKFMDIAWILRHKNNYNALGAVIAGINGTAIHRLSLTKFHVNATVHKKFMRLELLMGSHKSHFSYRLALENTSSERIPFIPLHRRDLVSAEEGNKTFLSDGERINWNKFQLMGDILMVILKSQTNPYPSLARNPAVERLILDTTINTNDDELYERSVALENTGHASRRPAWFRR